MELLGALTIWAMWAAFLILPLAGWSRWYARTAMALLVAEVLALAAWSYGSELCTKRPCAPLAETGRMAAALDIPLLAVVFLALVAGRGLRQRGPVCARRRGG